MTTSTTQSAASPPAGAGPDAGPTRRRPRSPRRRWLLVLVLVLIVALTIAGLVVHRQADRVPATAVTNTGANPSQARAEAVLGQPQSGGAWFSGAWTGGTSASSDRINRFATWRGTPVDAATTYPDTTSWQSIYDSNWHVTVFNDFNGILSYGLPMLPGDDTGDFASIVAGEHDDVYRQVATDLVAAGREKSIIRIGWEANGDWFPWNSTATDAASYVSAYRHIVNQLHAVAPDLIIDFDLACGTSLRGQNDRMDALNLLYPGDDVVDLVGCDVYDWYHTAATDESSWTSSLRPTDAVGIQDVADFARAHGKGLTIPEWGGASKAEGGMGDNPFYITKMRSWFEANSDILVLESYFSEPATSLANSIFDPVQSPLSAAEYAKLW